MKKLIMVVLGAALTAAGLNWFLIPARIAAGGVSGIATILENLFNIRASITVLVLNIPLLILAWIFKGKKTLFRALTGAVLMSFFLEVLSLSPFKVSDHVHRIEKFLKVNMLGILLRLAFLLIDH